MSAEAATLSSGMRINWTRLIALLTGVGLFIVIYYSPQWPDAIDPAGKAFPLSVQGKGAIAVFMLAGIWWILGDPYRRHQSYDRRHPGAVHDSTGERGF